MIIHVVKATLVVAFATLLAGCQTALVDQFGPLSVRSVSVSAKPTVQSATDIKSVVAKAATATIVKDMPNGRPASVHITVNGVNYKNAVMSLLVGSANILGTTVSVTDRSGSVIAEFPLNEQADYIFNGVIGAAIAATQDLADVDRKLSEEYAKSLAKRIYGDQAEQLPSAAPAPTVSPSDETAERKPARRRKVPVS
ncbi:MAG TPA: hypothetical protein VGU72_27025 [Beijerinckiaceae bacterium]|jgi:hypothetical protein|nr:hypothetical protein [Beijerinckiaceae bacterium]